MASERYIYIGDRWPGAILAMGGLAALAMLILWILKRPRPLAGWLLIGWAAICYPFKMPTMPFLMACYAIYGFSLINEFVNPSQDPIGKKKAPSKRSFVMLAILCIWLPAFFVYTTFQVIRLGPDSMSERVAKGLFSIKKAEVKVSRIGDIGLKDGWHFKNSENDIHIWDGGVYVDSKGHWNSGAEVAAAIEKWGGVEPSADGYTIVTVR